MNFSFGYQLPLVKMPDKAIASVLNRAGKTTGRGNGWTESHACSLRSTKAYREGERGEVTLDEAAAVGVALKHDRLHVVVKHFTRNATKRRKMHPKSLSQAAKGGLNAPAPVFMYASPSCFA
jgi:hypothetical protein